MGAWMWEVAHAQSWVGDREVKVRRGGGGDGGVGGGRGYSKAPGAPKQVNPAMPCAVMCYNMVVSGFTLI